MLLALAAACESGDEVPGVVGQLESDAVEISAEFAEPITAILVEEGEAVAPGQPLIEQDTARIRARIAETEALLAPARGGTQCHPGGVACFGLEPVEGRAPAGRGTTHPALPHEEIRHP
jgi:hypothetical protein